MLARSQKLSLKSLLKNHLPKSNYIPLKQVISRDQYERGSLEAHFAENNTACVGVDEVGRGCLAGPVFAAAVCLNLTKLAEAFPDFTRWIRDSKTLSAEKRRVLVPIIKENSYFWIVESATAEEIDKINISAACFLAMKRCLTSINAAMLSGPLVVLVDGNRPISDISHRQYCIIGGDQSCYSIAAASILAKEARDQFMREAADQFPAYGFERHVGYGTKVHLQSLQDHGICPLHRKSFRPVAEALSRSISI